MSVDLYERLKVRRHETGLSIAEILRVSLEEYLEPDNVSRVFLKLLREDLDFADEVRKTILAKKE